MRVLSASKARVSLYRLMDEARYEPVMITGRRNNVVMVSADEWRSIQETLYLESIPGMKESILAGGKLPLSACKKRIQW